MTTYEKILELKLNEILHVVPDLIVLNDGLPLMCIDELQKLDLKIDSERILIIFDHDIPAGSFETAEKQKKLIAFAKKYDIKLIQAGGIGYHMLTDGIIAEKSVIAQVGCHYGMYAAKGGLGLGLTSETLIDLLKTGETPVTGSVEIAVEITGALQENDQITDVAFELKDMLLRVNAKTPKVIIGGAGYEQMSYEKKKVLLSYLTRAGVMTLVSGQGMLEKTYEHRINFNVADVKPRIIMPGTNESLELAEVEEETIHACFIGGCMGGNIENLRHVYEIVKGKRVHDKVRVMVAPDTNETYIKAMHEGLIETFIDAGIHVSNPGCSSCHTTSIGVIGDGENMLSTGSYNFPGCCGTEKSRVFLASVNTVMQAALSGRVK